MKTWKPLFRSLLPAFLLASVSFVTNAQDVFKWGDLFFKIENGTATLTGPDGGTPANADAAYKQSTIVVPREITKDGVAYTVTKIADRALYFSSASEIYLPSTITTIEGSYSLANNSNLSKIVLPDGISDMGPGCLRNNTSLTEAWLPANLTTLTHSVFSGSALNLIAIPKNVTLIDNEAFRNNNLGSGVYLNQGLQQIYQGAFSGTQLTDISLPTSVTFAEGGGTSSAFNTESFISILIDCNLENNRTEKPYGNGYLSNVYVTNNCKQSIKLYTANRCILNIPKNFSGTVKSGDDSTPGSDWNSSYEKKFDIVLGTIPTFYYGDGSANLNSYLGSTTDGTGITYTTSTPDVITVNGSTVTFNKAGIAEVTATATDGSTIANPTRKFYVMPNTVVVGIADDGSFTYTSQTYSGDIAGRLTTKPTVATYNAGTEAEFSVPQGAESDCFVFVYDSKTGSTGGSTTPGPASVVLADFPDTYTYGTTQTINLADLDATVLEGIEGAALNYSSSNSGVATVDDNGLITVKGAGTTEITATPADETKINIESGATRQLTIAKAAAIMTVKVADGTTFTYGEPWNTSAFAIAVAPLYNGDETAKVLPEDYRPAYTVQFNGTQADTDGPIKNAGNHTVTVTNVPETANYELKAGDAATFTVDKKKITVTVKNLEITTEANEIPEPEFELEGVVDGDDEAGITAAVEVKWNVEKPLQPGSYEATVGGTHDNYEFVAAENNGRLTVTSPGYKLLFELTYDATEAMTATVSVTATAACNIKINNGEPFKVEAGTQQLSLTGVPGADGLLVMTVETDHPEYFTSIDVSRSGATELEIGEGATNLTDIDISDNSFGMDVELPDTLNEADVNIKANRSGNLEVEVGDDNRSVTLPEGYRPEDGCDVQWRDSEGNLLSEPEDFTYDAADGTYTFNKNMENVQGEITKGKSSVKTSQFDITGADKDDNSAYYAIAAPADMDEGSVKFRTDPADALRLNTETSQWEVKEGASVTFTVEPAAGYVVGTATLNGTDVEMELSGGDYTVDDVDEALTFEVTFVRNQTYSVYVTNQTPEGGEIEMVVSPARYRISGNDAVSTVLKGAKVTFTVVPAVGYKLDKATLTGVDVTDEITGDTYVIPSLNKLAVFEASFTKTTALGSVSALGNSISIQGRTLTFPGIDDSAVVTVTDVSGRTIASGTSSMSVELPAKGVYIIVIGEQSWKIAVK